ncbi:hypothetical protein L7F22_007039 [Adiantum nelumboides]|nr:hypothetical protein [Adiantum nelumboides]
MKDNQNSAVAGVKGHNQNSALVGVKGHVVLKRHIAGEAPIHEGVQMAGVGWTPAKGNGFIHAVDVHPSRKHVCVVGGSDGCVLAWDLRWQKEPIQLCGSADLTGQPLGDTMVESDVWEVKFDHLSFSGTSALSSKIPPIMFCSEDGILGVVEAGEVPWEILAEPCAINTFDINPESPTDVVCGLEFESLLYVKRPS